MGLFTQNEVFHFSYGTKTSVMYRRWMLWHFTIAIAALSLGFHCFVFVSTYRFPVIIIRKACFL